MTEPLSVYQPIRRLKKDWRDKQHVGQVLTPWSDSNYEDNHKKEYDLIFEDKLNIEDDIKSDKTSKQAEAEVVPSSSSVKFKFLKFS